MQRRGDGGWEPRIKLSSNPAKMTDPGRKRVIRYRDAEGHPVGDVMYLVDEEPVDVIDAGQPAKPVPFAERHELSFLRAVWDATRCESLLQPVMRQGARVGEAPTLDEIRTRARSQVAALPEELRRLRNPEIYAVGLSPPTGCREGAAGPAGARRVGARPERLTYGDGGGLGPGQDLVLGLRGIGDPPPSGAGHRGAVGIRR